MCPAKFRKFQIKALVKLGPLIRYKYIATRYAMIQLYIKQLIANKVTIPLDEQHYMWYLAASCRVIPAELQIAYRHKRSSEWCYWRYDNVLDNRRFNHSRPD